MEEILRFDCHIIDEQNSLFLVPSFKENQKSQIRLNKVKMDLSLIIVFEKFPSFPKFQISDRPQGSLLRLLTRSIG